MDRDDKIKLYKQQILLKQIENFESKTKNFDTKLKEQLDQALKEKNYEILDEIIERIKNHNDDNTATQLRIWNICWLVKNQKKYEEKTLLDVCSNVDEIVEQYTNIVFALRRIELAHDDLLLQDGIEYIKNMQLSPQSIEFILSKEYLEEKEKFYWLIYENSAFWNIKEQIIWLECMNSKFKTLKGSVKLLLLYIKNQQYQKAMAFINYLDTDAEEILKIKEKLKDLV